MIKDTIEMFTSKGDRFIIDSIDYERVSKHKWYRRNDGFFVTNISVEGTYSYKSKNKTKTKQKTTLLHRYIMNENDCNKTLHHADLDKSNNTRCNIIRGSKRGNSVFRRAMHSKNTSGYTGVVYSKKLNKYIATIQYNNKRIHVGKSHDPKALSEKVEAIRERLKKETILANEQKQ